MYHVVIGVTPDDGTLTEKIGAVTDLPPPVRVSLVHATDDPDGVEAVPNVARALDTLETAGVDAEAVGIDADPTRVILEYVAETDADCIRVAARQRTPAGERGLRLSGQRIVVTTDRPVLVVGDLPGSEKARS